VAGPRGCARIGYDDGCVEVKPSAFVTLSECAYRGAFIGDIAPLAVSANVISGTLAIVPSDEGGGTSLALADC